jgi:hypothetical protein
MPDRERMPELLDRGLPDLGAVDLGLHALAHSSNDGPEDEELDAGRVDGADAREAAVELDRVFREAVAQDELVH